MTAPAVTALETAALVALAYHDVPTDVQGLLVHGSATRSVPPGALRAAILAVVRALPGEVMLMLEAPVDVVIMGHRATVEWRWKAQIDSILAGESTTEATR